MATISLTLAPSMAVSMFIMEYRGGVDISLVTAASVDAAVLYAVKPPTRVANDYRVAKRISKHPRSACARSFDPGGGKTPASRCRSSSVSKMATDSVMITPLSSSSAGILRCGLIAACSARRFSSLRVEIATAYATPISAPAASTPIPIRAHRRGVIACSDGDPMRPETEYVLRDALSSRGTLATHTPQRRRARTM